jgi:hypothetical protein
MHTFYCRAFVGVFDPTTKHMYNEEYVPMCVEATHMEEAQKIYVAAITKARHPILPAYTTVHFVGASQIGGRHSIVGVIPFRKVK